MLLGEARRTTDQRSTVHSVLSKRQPLTEQVYEPSPTSPNEISVLLMHVREHPVAVSCGSHHRGPNHGDPAPDGARILGEWMQWGETVDNYGNDEGNQVCDQSLSEHGNES